MTSAQRLQAEQPGRSSFIDLIPTGRIRSSELSVGFLFQRHIRWLKQLIEIAVRALEEGLGVSMAASLNL